MKPFAILRIFALNVLLWTAICAIGALGSHSDWQQHGMERPYFYILGNWWRSHALMMVISTGLYLALSRWPQVLGRAGLLVAGYLGVLLFPLPVELLYISVLHVLHDDKAVTWSNVWTELFTMEKFTWFLEFAWCTFTYVAVVAIKTWREGRARDSAWQQAQTDNLNLRLELEQQRLQALRGQLEPHFIFNALNAISALVRGDDKRVALTGISRLSALLRYALAASSRDWVSMADELQFVRDYLALQQLRYGDRLAVVIEGDDGAVLAADCPPLLLQPLVENALRHDLDCHDGRCDIRIRFTREGELLHVRICNSLAQDVACNPGTGLGLRNTEARLRMACGDGASLRTEKKDGRFVAEIRMPMYGGAS